VRASARRWIINDPAAPEAATAPGGDQRDGAAQRKPHGSEKKGSQEETSEEGKA
jgi:hypothetical protein